MVEVSKLGGGGNSGVSDFSFSDIVASSSALNGSCI